MKIRNKLLFTFISFALGGILIFGVVIQLVTRTVLIEVHNRHLRTTVINQKQELQDKINGWYETASLIAGSSPLQQLMLAYTQANAPLRQQNLQKMLTETLASADTINALVLCDPFGNELAGARRFPTSSPMCAYTRDPNSTKQFTLVDVASTKTTRDIDDHFYVLVAGPVKQASQLIGFLVLSLKADALRDFNISSKLIGKTGETLIARRDSNDDAQFLTKLLRADNSTMAVRVSSTNNKVPIIHALAGRGTELHEDQTIDYAGVPVFAATQYLPDVDWGLVVKVDQSEALAPLARVRNTSLIYGVGLAIVLTLIAMGASTVLTQPITRLTVLAKRIRDGNRDLRADVTHDDEIGLLSKAFNQMLDSIQTATLQAQASDSKQTWLKLILNSISDGICRLNMDGKVEYINPAAQDLLGYTEKEMLGIHFHALLQKKKRDGSKYNFKDSPIYQVLQGNGPEFSVTNNENYWNKQGDPIFVEYKTQLIKSQGKPNGLVIVFRDITEQVIANTQLKQIALQDTLTELPNRKHCLDFLDTAIKKAERKNNELALIFIDLDNFKEINDRFGHDQGDHLLKTIGKRIQGSIRKSDFAARLGGDEFVTVIEDVTEYEQVNEVSQNILESTSKPIQLDEQDVRVTCSIGIALFPINGKTPSELLRFADQAMYESKRLGRNQRFWFSDSINKRFLRERYLGDGLNKALEMRQLTVAFQPVVNCNSDIIGVECLCRWEHQGKIITPREFIPIAEKFHLLEKLSLFVIDEALNALLQWREAFHFQGYVSINISLQQLRNPKFIKHIICTLSQRNIPVSKLLLEITESTLDDKVEGYQNCFDLIAEYNIPIALDNFGTGNASVKHLQAIPLMYLKIDESFVRHIHESSKATHAIATMLNLGESLQKNTIVGGVENEAQAQWLTKFGCHQQGFFHYQPLGFDECSAIFSQASH